MALCMKFVVCDTIYVILVNQTGILTTHIKEHLRVSARRFTFFTFFLDDNFSNIDYTKIINYYD